MNIDTLKPKTRRGKYLKAMATGETENLPKARNEEEVCLKYLAENMPTGNGGGNLNAKIEDILKRLGILEDKLKVKVSNLPILYLNGDMGGVNADTKITLDCKFLDVYNEPIFENKKCKVKWQGNGSLAYEKKNYGIDLLNEDGSKYKHKFFEDVEENDSYHIKANYTDGGTHARNIVSVNVIKDMYKEPLPGNARGCIDGFPILLNINGENKGLYTWNLKQHATVYKLDKKNPNHLMYRAQAFKGTNGYPVKFRALSTDNREDVPGDWEDKFPGTNSVEGREKLNRLIGWVMSCENNPSKFKEECSQYFNVNYLIDYLCWAGVGGFMDSLGPNMNIVTYNGLIWYPTFYDCDSTWGIRWNGQAYGSNEFSYGQVDSLLWKLVKESYEKEIIKRIREILVNKELIVNSFVKFNNSLNGELEKDLELYPNCPSKSYGLEYIKTWIDERFKWLEANTKYSKQEALDIKVNNTIIEINADNPGTDSTIIKNIANEEYNFTVKAPLVENQKWFNEEDGYLTLKKSTAEILSYNPLAVMHGIVKFEAIFKNNLSEETGLRKLLFRYQRATQPYNGIVVMRDTNSNKITVEINSKSRIETKYFDIPTTEDIKISLIIVKDTTLLLINDNKFETFSNTPEFDNAEIILGTDNATVKIKSLKLSYDMLPVQD